MGNKLFGVDISGLINKNIGPGVNDCLLVKVTAGSRTSGSLAAGVQPTSKNYTAKGFIDKLDKTRQAATLVEDGDVLIALIGDSIASNKTPVPGDRIKILNNTYNVIQVDTDPAQAVYNCVSRSN